MTTIAVTVAVGVLVVALSAAVGMLYVRLHQLRSRYHLITDAEAEGRRLQADSRRNAEEITAAAKENLNRLQQETTELQKRRDTLSSESTTATAAKELLQKEVSVLEENLEDISFGIYKPHFQYDTPDGYKVALESVIDKQRQLVRTGNAARFAVEWSVGGSKREGERMQKQYTKLLLRAFNGESEAAIAKVAWNTATRMEERIRKAFDAINELGGVMQVSIADAYMNLKLQELRLEHELAEKKHAELEEQRRVREQMREQERAQRELEAAAADAEQEEDRFARALEKARLDVARAEGKEHARLTGRILELEEELKRARQKRERVRALAELTKAGYLYVLSNIGSFGENMFKIGMTRRLDPMDRVRELGDASVPFRFDVHAMVYDDDAVKLENEFHEQFASRAVNPMNMRKEFFRVSIDELQTFAKERGLKIAFTRLPEAREYRETMARRREVAAAALTESATRPPICPPVAVSSGQTR